MGAAVLLAQSTSGKDRPLREDVMVSREPSSVSHRKEASLAFQMALESGINTSTHAMCKTDKPFDGLTMSARGLGHVGAGSATALLKIADTMHRQRRWIIHEQDCCRALLPPLCRAKIFSCTKREWGKPKLATGSAFETHTYLL